MAVQVIASSYSDGPTLTAAAAASMLPTYVVTTLPAGYFQIGRQWRITMSGRVSCVVTTPGTFRINLRLGAVTAWDSLAIPLNIVAQTNVPWFGEILLTCRSVGSGTSATLFGMGRFNSTAFLNVPAVATGPWSGIITVPYNTAPVVGTGFDSTAANALDMQFTQTVATGSFTLHQMLIEQLTP
ncbi:MAG TPA: hypothetical protein VLH56_11535 [Dissulfurispiraceae bacterium]|nr:hypothetical protein [Dissulfurispiraceae bacterium]